MTELTAQFLEAINGTLLGIFLGLMFFFVRYIGIEYCKQRRRHGYWDAVVESYYRRRAAIAMLLLIAGDTIIRGNVWAWRHFDLSDKNPIISNGVTVGVVLCIIGGTCALRHFSPESWGRAPWVLIPLISMVFGVGMAL